MVVWSTLDKVSYVDKFGYDETFTVEEARNLREDVKERLLRRSGLSSMADFQNQLAEAIKSAANFSIDEFLAD